jgi:hypothetical protein
MRRFAGSSPVVSAGSTPRPRPWCPHHRRRRVAGGGFRMRGAWRPHLTWDQESQRSTRWHPTGRATPGARIFIMARWSSGTEPGFSIRGRGFDSRTRYVEGCAHRRGGPALSLPCMALQLNRWSTGVKSRTSAFEAPGSHVTLPVELDRTSTRLVNGRNGVRVLVRAPTPHLRARGAGTQVRARMILEGWPSQARHRSANPWSGRRARRAFKSRALRNEVYGGFRTAL